jgi:GNAT superfamily N-acetyltransferase
VPLTHALGAAHLAHLPGIAAHYQVHGQVPVFRLPAGAESVHRVLAREGFAPHEPTWVQVVTAGELMQATAVHGGGVARVSLSDHASPAWQAVFLGPGFDPVDGAHRVRNLSRAAGTLYVSAQIGSATVACGAASFSGGWMGVHGMRTAQAHRGQGLAGQVLQAMAQAACQRDVDRVFLQVGAANRAAQALYHRLGFATAWAYAYWRSA